MMTTILDFLNSVPALAWGFIGAFLTQSAIGINERRKSRVVAEDNKKDHELDSDKLDLDVEKFKKEIDAYKQEIELELWRKSRESLIEYRAEITEQNRLHKEEIEQLNGRHSKEMAQLKSDLHAEFTKRIAEMREILNTALSERDEVKRENGRLREENHSLKNGDNFKPAKL